jgi:hypothetical protein
MDPEARQRVDPVTALGPPRYYALEGKLLEFDPTPDAAYEVEHCFYSADPARLEAPWTTVSVLGALAALVTDAQGPRLTQALEAMVQAEVQLLQSLYVPGTYDASRDARQAITGGAG